LITSDTNVRVSVNFQKKVKIKVGHFEFSKMSKISPEFTGSDTNCDF